MNLRFEVLLITAIIFTSSGLCDVEVVNFHAKPQHPTINVESLRSGHDWLSIAPSTRPVLLEVSARGEAYVTSECGLEKDTPPGTCPGDTWIILDLGLNTNATRLAPKWAPASHSIRVSWPASSPASFHIRVYDHPEMATLVSITAPSDTSSNSTLDSRSRFARIRAHHRGIRPSPQDETLRIPYHVTFEPLILGVLPTSLAPTIMTLAVVAFVSSLGVPYVLQYLQEIASAASLELAQHEKNK